MHEGTGNRDGELLLMLQPLPHRGTGLIRGELLRLARGAALLQSSDTPRLKAQGQCGDGRRLRGQSQIWGLGSTVLGRGDGLIPLLRCSEKHKLRR